MASASASAMMALPLPGVRGPVACPAPLRLRPARAGLVLAARAPPRSSVSVRCATENGNHPAGRDPGPGGVHGPAVDAMKRAVADTFRPLLDNFNHVRSMKNVWDVNDYNIGMPFGVLMACVGCYRLFKMDPRTFLDVVVGYALYKLSVLSSEVDRRGFANDFITRIKAAIALGMFLAFPRDRSNLALGIMRLEVTFLYCATFLYDINGWKQDGRDDVSKVCGLLFKQN